MSVVGGRVEQLDDDRALRERHAPREQASFLILVGRRLAARRPAFTERRRAAGVVKAHRPRFEEGIAAALGLRARQGMSAGAAPDLIEGGIMGRQLVGEAVHELAAALAVVGHPRHVEPAGAAIDLAAPADLVAQIGILAVLHVVDDVLDVAGPFVVGARPRSVPDP